MKYKKYAKKMSKVGGLSKKQVREVKSLIGAEVEQKTIINVIAPTTIGATGTDCIAIADPDQGNTDGDRIGDEITVKRIMLKVKLVAPAQDLIFSAADQYNYVRVVLVKWLMDDTPSVAGGSGGEQPLVASILNTTGSDLTIASFSTVCQGKKFQVCYDKLITLYNTPVYQGTSVKYYAGVDSTHIINIDLFGKKLHSPKIHFKDGSIYSVGQYYLFAVSDSAYSPHPALTAEGNVFYTDA